jgi:putative transposase
MALGSASRKIYIHVAENSQSSSILPMLASHKQAASDSGYIEAEMTSPSFCTTAIERIYISDRWFGLITQRAIRRGSLGSVKDLVDKINAFV